MNIQLIYSSIIALLLLSASPSPVRAEPASTQTPSITWENLKVPEMNVQFDSFRQKVNVTLKKETLEYPRSIGITFFDADGNKTEVELKALSPLYDPNARLGHYSGALSARSAPFVGFEIKIPFGSTSHKIIKSTEFKKRVGEDRQIK